MNMRVYNVTFMFYECDQNKPNLILCITKDMA